MNKWAVNPEERKKEEREIVLKRKEINCYRL